MFPRQTHATSPGGASGGVTTLHRASSVEVVTNEPSGGYAVPTIRGPIPCGPITQESPTVDGAAHARPAAPGVSGSRAVVGGVGLSASPSPILPTLSQAITRAPQRPVRPRRAARTSTDGWGISVLLSVVNRPVDGHSEGHPPGGPQLPVVRRWLSVGDNRAGRGGRQDARRDEGEVRRYAPATRRPAGRARFRADRGE